MRVNEEYRIIIGSTVGNPVHVKYLGFNTVMGASKFEIKEAAKFLRVGDVQEFRDFRVVGRFKDGEYQEGSYDENGEFVAPAPPLESFFPAISNIKDKVFTKQSLKDFKDYIETKHAVEKKIKKVPFNENYKFKEE